VAVKVIHSDLSGDPDYVARFDREARAAAILAHPNIVAVFDQGFIGERPYIVMEYIRGQSLRSIIKSSAPLPVTTALGYADEIAKAISAAHTAGIIHRDIKPENVLITNNRELKVTDFGLAKDISAHTSAASQGVIMGSISYIAPEIPATGAAVKASDVYSTGIVLYEMLTGHKPHTGKDISQVLWKHMNEDVPAPSTKLPASLRSRIPDYLDALVVACTQRDPNVRWSNGQLLQQKISAVRQNIEEGKTTDPELVEEFSSLSSGVENTPVSPIPSSHEEREEITLEDTPVQTKTPMVTRLANNARDIKRPKKTNSTSSSSRPAGGALLRRVSNITKERPQLPRRVLGLVVGLAVIVLGLGWWFGFGQWTTIPALSMKNETDARSVAAEHSLSLEPMYEYHETIAEGLIIRTDPEEGSRLHRSSTVTVYISKGPERYAMPTVVGLTQEEAEEAIANAHLAKGTVTAVWHDTIPTGKVVSASQSPGTPLKPNTPVDLSVSKGREPITVDSFVGKPKDEAIAGLQAAGFQVTTKEDFSANHAAGLVSVQTPADGTLFRGQSVELTISKGPKYVEVPDVRNMSRAEATTAIARNFRPEIKVDSTVGVPLGLAKGTDPPAGTMAAEGSTVIIFVG
jgi:serine/threonine-protein kinase